MWRQIEAFIQIIVLLLVFCVGSLTWNGKIEFVTIKQRLKKGEP